MKKFEEPVIRKIAFSVSDVVTTSVTPPPGTGGSEEGHNAEGS